MAKTFSPSRTWQREPSIGILRALAAAFERLAGASRWARLRVWLQDGTEVDAGSADELRRDLQGILTTDVKSVHMEVQSASAPGGTAQ
jgi:hypothetical protein